MKQLSPFLAKLKETIIDEESYNIINYWGLKKKVKNWPEIKYKDGGYAPDDEKHNGELREESLDLENFEPLYLDSNKFIFEGGGDWQYPYTVTIKLKENKLAVTDLHPYKRGEYKGINNKDIIRILQAEDILETKKDKEALVNAQDLIDKTKELWKSKNIESIIKQIKDSEEIYKKGTWTLIKKHLEKLIPENLKDTEHLKTKSLIKEDLPKDNTEEGKLLIAALAKITVESQTDKDPDEVFNQIKTLKAQIYDSSQNDIKKKSVVGIVFKGDTVLLGEAVTDDDRNGYLCFPGGGVEENETLQRAVKREVREESNILAKFRKESLTTSNKPNVFFFIGKYISGTIQYNSEYKNMSWYNINNLPIDRIYPQNKNLLKALFKKEVAKKDKAFILENTEIYKKGQIIDSYIPTKKGILSGKTFIPKKNYILLNEKLSNSDTSEIRAIVKKMLISVFWKMYTKANFFVD